ncbi:MAG: acetyltransferase [Candidatus Hodarchaeota archaeon]
MKVVIIGAGGHARVVYECLRYDKNLVVQAFIDIVEGDGSEIIMEIPVLGPHSVIPDLIKKGVKGFIVAVGDNEIRAKHFKKFQEMGLIPVNAIHPTASIAYNVKIGQGVCIGINAIINTNAIIGDNTIINTGAIVEHEDRIGNNVHIAPGTSVAGRVKIEDGVFIGIGSVIKEYITIGENTIIGAGSVVLKDIPKNVVAVGSPAKIIKENDKGAANNG